MEITNVTGGFSKAYQVYKEKSKAQESEKKEAASQADEFVKSDKHAAKATYGKLKKLTPEQIEDLKENEAKQKADMLRRMVQANFENQSNAYGMSVESQNLIKEIFGSIEEGIPPLAVDAVEAQKAVEEGGAYSVQAVADRIMKMAKALSGADPDKIGLLKEAVEKGFKQAGVDFKKLSGQKLPQICLDTYDEVMKQFDNWQKEYAAG